jgi:hypothetical protein
MEESRQGIRVLASVNQMAVSGRESGPTRVGRRRGVRSDHHTYFVGGEDWGFSVWAHNEYQRKLVTSADEVPTYASGKCDDWFDSLSPRTVKRLYADPDIDLVRCAPCKGVSFQWVQFPSGKGSLQPVAIGAVREATNSPKPSVQRVALGDPASR